MALKDFDLNIHDMGSYESSGKYSAWQIDIYPEGSNHFTPEKIIYLNKTQAEMLELELQPEDFWTNAVSFLWHFEFQLPRKVRRILQDLEEIA